MAEGETEAEKVRKIVQAGYLLKDEMEWAARFEQLKAYGYLLRPRYRPGWIRPWNPGESLLGEEEAITPVSTNLDALRVSDGTLVFLKLVSKSSPEIEIGRLLASDELRLDPRNHTIPLLDVIEDSTNPERVILVLPSLRSIDSPSPTTVKECLDLVNQTLEASQALVFLHEHHIAHRDCAMDNIMLDGRALFPGGWHPQRAYATPDAQHAIPEPSLREAKSVSYYLIDFGISTLNQNMTTGNLGQERAPELSDDTPYDPYKLDVYILGMAYKRFFSLQFEEIGFILPLVEMMTHEDPTQRPTALAAYEKFKSMQADLSSADLDRRLPVRSPRESATERFWNDFKHALLDLWWNIRPKRSAEPIL
ncbi:hypothetical protein FS837_004350 [Tulasnella sp. UAMH 9824]|nr:hypothetical protein FS837_004350 [Tulasnella sp. UAMH 9824]